MKNLIKFYVLVLLIASGNCAYNTRQRGRQGNNARDGGATDRVRGRGRTCSSPRLTNGFVVPLFKGKMIRFDCNKGFYRLGERYAECANGRWSIYSFPICIKNGCSAVSAVDNGKITYLNRNATAMLFCEPNYEIVGSSYAHCTGANWDRSIGTCKETDNSPSTSCDFESESICGWMHDTDHDLDFERRSGYNNKTLSILTGPSSDHTVKLPFQGHYMVINTNTDVFTKTARLISPLYRMNATKLCFQLYYHMYGISVGTLRVYAKPESTELQDVLIEDMEAEPKNDYLIFEMKGTQGNAWHRGGGMIKQYNESFQIIIEATSGQTRLSDIAIDDVSLLSDEDCDNNDTDSDDDVDTKETSQKEETDDNGDGVFSIDSCVNRCFEESNATIQLNANGSLSCSCSRDCDPRATCCPDFLDVCSDSLPETTQPTTTTAPTTSTTTEKIIKTTATTKTSTTLVTTPLRPNNTTTTTTITTTTTATTTKVPLTTTTTTTTPETTSTSSSTLATQTATTTQSTGVTNSTASSTSTTDAQSGAKGKASANKAAATARTTLSDLVEIEDEHDMMREVEEGEEGEGEEEYEPGNMTNEKLMMQTERDERLSFVITTLVITVSSTLLTVVALWIVYKQYKKSTNPLNYKEKGENGSRRADEEFSEIRYLTSDEALDFTLASPDNITDL